MNKLPTEHIILNKPKTNEIDLNKLRQQDKWHRRAYNTNKQFQTTESTSWTVGTMKAWISLSNKSISQEWSLNQQAQWVSFPKSPQAQANTHR